MSSCPIHTFADDTEEGVGGEKLQNVIIIIINLMTNERALFITTRLGLRAAALQYLNEEFFIVRLN